MTNYSNEFNERYLTLLTESNHILKIVFRKKLIPVSHFIIDSRELSISYGNNVCDLDLWPRLATNYLTS